MLLDQLERICENPLQLSRSARWSSLRGISETAARKTELGVIEDEIDAILCAYLAWLWGRREPGTRVLGDVTTGYIVLPGPALPPHP